MPVLDGYAATREIRALPRTAFARRCRGVGLPLLRALLDDEQCATAHAELPEDVMQVLLDRGFRDAESLRDLPVGHSLHQQIDDFPLAASERRGQLVRRRRSLLAPVALPSLAFAAVAQTPVCPFTTLDERPLQFGRGVPVGIHVF